MSHALADLERNSSIVTELKDGAKVLSDDKKDDKKEDKSDITRIEDLSEYLHEEDDDIEELDSELAQANAAYDDEDLMDAKTDPNIEFPAEFSSNFDEETGPDADFSSLENQEDSEREEEDPPQFDQEQSEAGSFENHEEANDFESSNFESEEFESPEFEGGDFENGDFENDQFESSATDDAYELEEEPNIENFGGENESSSMEDPTLPELEEDDRPESSLEPEPSLEPESSQEPESEEIGVLKEKTDYKRKKSPLPQMEEPTQYKAPENFQELQRFAKNITYGNLASEGNPPFSIILRDIKYEEDVQDIVILLKEFKILANTEEEENAKKSLGRGMMLIPRLGEYAAITICHKLRKFDMNVLMGLTEEIHPPKGYDSDDSGLVSKHTVYNSRAHHYNLEKNQCSPAEILTATTPYLEGHDIIEYVGIASENSVISSSLLESSSFLEEELIEKLPDTQQEKQRLKQVERSNQASAASMPIADFFPGEDNSSRSPGARLSLKEIHQDLLAKLKSQAAAQKGNALVGINFHVSPLTSATTKFYESEAQYQVMCSGSVVWVNKR